ncbi:2,3,4,5-tetrahydropyridine-2,6-dicarboxylate N-succinyltransferase [Winogradskya humida]|uniref:2,3,4,5-tetrahydropyridine-2,6-dicarboxylate N-succinyltransferase n=1 Tax=Winogradskya humida TaxID=113566 RepID=A0ABQ3ZX80_9ACTN|nr:2,3,4,5-tetrahydropyridine-2,6-dicarboxylate N-succinyltransferase [Actinoplanes humidus]GIE23221.1 2,3,4,5-tetrahydropyridine-2,6-dicarboxylate N-succinyltransferase [Actinoplanes humidus]
MIDELWERRAGLSPADEKATLVVTEALDRLDRGVDRVAGIDPVTDAVVVDERSRRAILLAFRLYALTETHAGPFHFRDRLPLKQRFDGVRLVPGAIARFGAYLAPGSVLMPSFVNVGAYVGAGTMVDTWATVGSCAQIGARVHLSGGVGIGGVLEPEGAVPVVVEDDAFVGSRSIVVEGARVRTGANLGAGTLLTGTTRVVDATTGEDLPRGEAPPWSVCVTAYRQQQFPGGVFGTPCLLVLRRLAPGETPDNLRISELFREHGYAL